MNKMYGFEGEVKSKYTTQMADFFTEIFDYLPLCHLINNKIFVSDFQSDLLQELALNSFHQNVSFYHQCKTLEPFFNVV